MKTKATVAARLLMGLIFVVFGLNGFLRFIPMPPPPPEAGQFLGALAATGYFFPILKIVEILCGAALLANVFVPLALVVLAPVVFNIVTYHLFLDPAGMAMPIFIVIMGVWLAIGYKGHFKDVLAMRSRPTI